MELLASTYSNPSKRRQQLDLLGSMELPASTVSEGLKGTHQLASSLSSAKAVFERLLWRGAPHVECLWPVHSSDGRRAKLVLMSTTALSAYYCRKGLLMLWNTAGYS